MKNAARSYLSLMLPLVLMLTGCPRSEEPPNPVTTTKPAPAEPDLPPANVDPNFAEVRITSLADPQTGWLRIGQIRKDAPGAWATGSLVRDNKLVIETEDVEEFSIRLTDMHINWTGRVILRINGQSSELMKRNRQVLRLKRSQAGSWDAVEP